MLSGGSGGGRRPGPGPVIFENQIHSVKDLSSIPEDEDMEGGSLYSGIEYAEDKESYVSSLLEQSLDMNSDLEQMEAIEVANLLQEIEKLQMHQIEERKELIRKHQLQLQSLDAENLETQMMFVQQRQVNNGGQPHVTASQLVNKTVSGPQNVQKFVPLDGAIPKTTPGTSFMSKKMDSGGLDALARLQSLGVLSVQVQKGRPLPTFHEAVREFPEDQDVDGDCIESGNDSLESQSHIDGICPLPDSGSEFSELPDEKLYAESDTLAYQVQRLLDFQSNQLFSSNSNDKNKIDKNSEVLDNNEFSKRRPKLTDFRIDTMNCNREKDLIGVSQNGTNPSLHSTAVMLERRVRDNGTLNARSSLIQETKDMEEHSDTIRNKDEVSTEESIKQDLNFDERPVLGNKKKTFEELLEEELMKDQDHQAEGRSETVGKYSFLRKREGLAKFEKQPLSKSHQSWKHSTPRASKKRKSVPQARNSAKNVASNMLLKSDDLKVPSSKLRLKRPIQSSTVASTNEIASEESSRRNFESSLPAAEAQKKLLLTDNGKPAQSKNNLPAANPSRSSGSQANNQSKFSASSSMKLAATAADFTQPAIGNKTAPLVVASGSWKSVELAAKTVESRIAVPNNFTADASFNTCLEKRVEHEKVELEELQEFELLERYADDNASFLSNISSVNRVLGQHREMKKNQIHEDARKISEINREAEEESRSCDEMSCSTSNSSSSTTIEESDYEDASVDHHDVTLKEETAARKRPNEMKSTDKIKFNSGPQTVPRKIASSGRVNAGPHAGNPSDSDDDDDDDDNHGNDNDQDVVAGHGDAKHLSATASQSSNKESRTTDFGMIKQRRVDAVNSMIPEKSDSSAKFKTLNLENSLDDIDNDTSVNCFEDDRSWNEHCSPLRAFGKTENLDRKSAIQNHSSSVNNGETDSVGDSVHPPISQLVSKLFPKLKPDPPKLKPDPPKSKLQVQPEQKSTESCDGAQSKLLREKIAEMENEIEKFRNQNAALEKLRKEREEGLTLLKKEMADFEKEKQNELNRLQEFKSLKTKKLRKERKVFEQYQKSLRELPNKKERDEIESLKSQLARLQEDVQKKEQRWTSSTMRLRDRVEMLEKENLELKEENRLLEQRRLEMWQSKKSVDPVAMPAIAKKSQETEMNGVSTVASGICPPLKSKPTHSEKVLQLDGTTEFVQTQAPSLSNVPTVAFGSGHAVKASDGRRNTPASMKIIPSDNIQPVNDALTPRTSNSEPILRHGSLENHSDSTKTVARKTASIQSNSVVNSLDKGDNQYEEVKHKDGKVERIFSNGMREIHFPNGTWKQVSSDAQSVVVFFFNGDIKRILPDQKIVYFYADTQTTHTTFPDGLEICEFPNQYIEKSYPDGTKEILLSDGTVRYIFPSGVEESIYPDGTNIRVEKNGDMIKEFANGQREILTQAYKRREFPDGTVKTVFPDGRQETRYSSGRLRIKDKEGNVIVDKPVMITDR